ncbi:methenyltetrahydrofolate synthase domain-containing protein isoform X1 [Lepisosteus oculatus]|uniref:methenyltetrahydrofolate synthase domain-containing protein isoform X1 n=1 Tax=Lepisosteus oculatus TaxID=7918 RepID=UPI0035F52409
MDPAVQLKPGVTKWDIRQKVWDYIEANNLANFPRPVHHRIPNFKGAYRSCDQLASLGVLQHASEVKVDPDKPLEGARLAVLQAGKTLLVPTPRLRTGLFNRIVPPQRATKEDLRICSTSQGVKQYSVPVGLDAKVHVDLVVVGSVAVSEKGYRIGKGEGFADMEYAMMVSMGAVNDSTIIVTVVHDCQVVDLPEELVEGHDLTVDYILTPSRVIKTGCSRPKPQGIFWAKLDSDMLDKIPILKKLRYMEQEAGKDVTLKKMLSGTAALGERPSGVLTHSSEGRGSAPGPRDRDSAPGPGDRDSAPGPRDRDSAPGPGDRDSAPGPGDRDSAPGPGDRDSAPGPGDRDSAPGPGDRDSAPGPGDRDSAPGPGDRGRDSDSKVKNPGQDRTSTIYIGSLPPSLRVRELKSALRERGAVPVRLNWQGAQRRAFLDYSDQQTAERVLAVLQGFCINGNSIRAELAASQRNSWRAGQVLRRPRTTSTEGGAEIQGLP